MLFALSMMAAMPAWAGPPFITDDPEIPPPGGWEIDVPFTLEHTHGETDMQAPLFDVNYVLPGSGIVSQVQWTLEVPVVVVDRDDGPTTAGPGDTQLGAKWQFLEEQGWAPTMAVFPQFLVPTGDRYRGLGEGAAAYILPFLAEKNWGKWTVYGDAAYVVQTAQGARNYFYEGVSINRQITDRLELGGEIVENAPPPTEGYHNLAFNLGGTWKVNDELNLLFSAGRSIYGETEFMTYFGIQILLGGQK